MLAELESRVGTKGRRKFEKFLREAAEDEDDVEFETRLALLAAHRQFPADIAQAPALSLLADRQI